MSDYDDIQKRCARGFPRHLSHHEAIHDLLADCYGAIGELRKKVTELSDEAYEYAEQVESLQNRWASRPLSHADGEALAAENDRLVEENRKLKAQLSGI